MKNILAALLSLFTLVQCSHSEPASPSRHPSQANLTLNNVELKYPAIEPGDQAYSYFGESFKNEYEAFEVDDGPVARSFVEAQNALTRKVLDSAPRRAEIKGYLDSYAAASAPIPRFFGGQGFVVEKGGVHRMSDSGQKELLIDLPQILAQTRDFDMQKDVPSIIDFNLSPDMKNLAMLVAFNGRDFDAKIYLFDMEARKIRTNEVIKDALNYTPVFGTFTSTMPVWSEDSSSFIYTRLLTNRDVTNRNNIMLAPARTELVRHEIGDSASRDAVVFRRHTQDQTNEVIQVLPSGIADHVFVTMFNTFYTPNFFGLLNTKTKQVKYYQREARLYRDNHFGYLGKKGDYLYFRTDRNYKNGAILRVKWNDFDLKDVSYVVTPRAFPIDAAFMADERLFVITIRDIAHHLEIYDLNGKSLSKPALPGKGSLSGFSHDPKANTVYFGYSDYTTPRTLMSYDINDNKVSVLDRPALKFNPSKFVVTRSFIRSRDGKRIPTTEIHASGTDKNKLLPTYLYFYGNVAAAVLPNYNATTQKFLGWVEMGGRVVIAHVRGGTELGAEWSYAGMRLNKMNTMNDVIDVARNLVADKRTTAKQTVLSGRSSAGFASAAAMLLAPEQFGMLTTVVPLTDMLRYQKSTCGSRWEVEYGLSSDRQDFNILKRTSPIHISQPGQEIPPTIIFTAEKDDRVPPHHAMKLAATLQKNSGHINPVLFYEEPKASHAARKEGLDELSFASLVIPW